jgi:hypothetical protein
LLLVAAAGGCCSPPLVVPQDQQDALSFDIEVTAQALAALSQAPRGMDRIGARLLCSKTIRLLVQVLGLLMPSLQVLPWPHITLPMCFRTRRAMRFCSPESPI